MTDRKETNPDSNQKMTLFSFSKNRRWLRNSGVEPFVLFFSQAPSQSSTDNLEDELRNFGISMDEKGKVII
jgi:hypothetical protein